VVAAPGDDDLRRHGILKRTGRSINRFTIAWACPVFLLTSRMLALDLSGEQSDFFGRPACCLLVTSRGLLAVLYELIGTCRERWFYYNRFLRLFNFGSLLILSRLQISGAASAQSAFAG